MFPDFTILQNVNKPTNVTMISGPISYTRFKIFHLNTLIKEIEIFGDAHYSEKGNCTEQGESCIYVDRTGLIVDNNDNDEVNCLDIPTYLGYAILDAHVNHKYTDIHIESKQQERGRHSYTMDEDDPIWDAGFLIKTETFLRSCGTSIDRNSLCRDSPNGERNWARVHSNDIRNETMSGVFNTKLAESLYISKFRLDRDVKKRAIKVLTYLRDHLHEFITAFTKENLGEEIRNIFLPFYDDMYPNISEKEQKELIKKNYPFIHIIMNEFGGYGSTFERKTFSRAEKGTLILKKNDILTHRVGKTYSKVMKMREQYESDDIQHIMISAYEKYVSHIQTLLTEENIIEYMDTLLYDYKKVNIRTSNEKIDEVKKITNFIITRLFSHLFDIYSIGRLISYPESERIIYFAGDSHSERLRTYITDYLIPEIDNSNVDYVIIRDINITINNNTDELNRCMRIPTSRSSKRRR